MGVNYDFYNGFHFAIISIEIELMKTKDAATLKKVRAINRKLHEEIVERKKMEEEEHYEKQRTHCQAARNEP